MNASPRAHIPLTGFVITFLGSIFFSTKAIIVKTAFFDTKVDALTLLTIRMLLSLPFYVVAAIIIGRREEQKKLTKRQWGYILFLGICGYYFSSLFDFIGLQYISAGLERLILFLYPTFAVLINAVVFKQKIPAIQKVALLVTYAGIATAYYGELSIDTGNPGFYFGSFMIFLCAVTYSIYIAVSGKAILSIGANKFTAYVMITATAGIFIHFALGGNIAILRSSPTLWFYGLVLAVAATVIPSFLISQGMKKIGTNNVAIISSIGPVSTIVQAHLILGERVFTTQIAGTLLVVAGVLLTTLQRKPSVNV